jgi:hypothetical protein
VFDGLSEQSSSVAVKNVRKYGIIGLAMNLVGMAWIHVGWGLVLLGMLKIEGAIALLTPLGEVLYELGLVIVVVVAARAGVPMKYLVVAGSGIGIGFFYVAAPHEIHMGTGLGFGLIHPAHIGTGAMVGSFFVAVIAVLAFIYNWSQLQGDKKSTEKQDKVV